MDRSGLKLAERQPDLKPVFCRNVTVHALQLYRDCKTMFLVFQLYEWQIGGRDCFRRIAPDVKCVAAEIRRPVAHADHAQLRLPASARHGAPLQAKGIRRREEIFLLDGKRSRQQLNRAGEHRPSPDRKSTRLNSSHLVISYAV